MFNRRIGMCIAKSLHVTTQQAKEICAEAAKEEVSIETFVGERINWAGVLGKTHSRPGGTHGSTRRRLFKRMKSRAA